MKRFLFLLPLVAITACTKPVAAPVAGPPPPAPFGVSPPRAPVVAAPAPPPANAAFATWLDQYRRRALARGVAPAAVESLLAGIELQPRVLALDRRQPGDSGSATARFDAYLARQVDGVRIALGVAAANRVSTTLASVQARTGVPGEILVAIWGLESGYGKVTGNFDVPSSLATLAWDGRRAALFTAELDAALTIIEKGLATRAALRGSWAGAMGQPQFLPSSFLSYGVDGDGDGRADIWGNEADTLMSIGNYFKAKGWQPGLSWGLPVTLPAGFDRADIRPTEKPKSCVRPLEKHSRWLPIATWKAKGLTGIAAFPADDVPAALIEPDGDGQGAYLVTRNYRVIMDYNCSNFYALSVALLGDAISNRPR
jgi:lytic murein transglycosylase